MTSTLMPARASLLTGLSPQRLRVGSIRSSQRGSRSDLHHLKIFLAGAAFRTSPVHRHSLPRGSGCNSVVGVAGGFVIDPTAYQAHPCAYRAGVFAHVYSLS